MFNQTMKRTVGLDWLEKLKIFHFLLLSSNLSLLHPSAAQRADELLSSHHTNPAKSPTSSFATPPAPSL